MTDVPLTRDRIYAALGVSPEEAAAFEATPEYRSYLRAKAEADAATEAWLAYARMVAERVSEKLNEKLGEVDARAMLDARVLFDVTPVLPPLDEEGRSAS